MIREIVLDNLFESNPDLYDFRFNLGDIEQSRASLRFQYNEIIDRWFFNFELDNDVLLCGAKIVPNVNLLFKLFDQIDFGILYARTLNQEPITRNSFRDRHAILYYDE